jgi:polar amino acid transport system substrate-binding protein
MTKGQADICFLAIEPAREAEIAFTAPYVVIEGVFVVRRDSAITASADVDREGVRIGVKQGSAYDLYLSRSLQHASVVRGDEGVDVFCDLGLEVAAGIRQPMTEFVDLRPEFRLLEKRFMEIQQAMGTTRTRAPETVQFLREYVEELKASGFVAHALRRANQPDATVGGSDDGRLWSAGVRRVRVVATGAGGFEGAALASDGVRRRPVTAWLHRRASVGARVCPS